MNPLKEMIESMMGKEERNTSITSHYGVKDEQFTNWTDDMLCDFIKLKTTTDVIDKWFKEDSAEDRAKIMAFVEAYLRMARLNRR